MAKKSADYVGDIAGEVDFFMQSIIRRPTQTRAGVVAKDGSPGIWGKRQGPRKSSAVVTAVRPVLPAVDNAGAGFDISCHRGSAQSRSDNRAPGIGKKSAFGLREDFRLCPACPFGSDADQAAYRVKDVHVQERKGDKGEVDQMIGDPAEVKRQKVWSSREGETCCQIREKEFVPACGSTTYQPVASAIMPMIQVTIMPIRMYPFMLNR